jgi:hypothetical protein
MDINRETGHSSEIRDGGACENNDYCPEVYQPVCARKQNAAGTVGVEMREFGNMCKAQR